MNHRIYEAQTLEARERQHPTLLGHTPGAADRPLRRG